MYRAGNINGNNNVYIKYINCISTYIYIHLNNLTIYNLCSGGSISKF